MGLFAKGYLDEFHLDANFFASHVFCNIESID